MQIKTTRKYYLSPVRIAIINKSKIKCWWRYGEKGTLLHCWWECRLVQPLWKAVWRYLKELKMDLPLNPVIPLLGIYLKKPKTLIWKNISTLMGHRNVIYNHQDTEAAQVSISRWVDKTTIGHLHSGILLPALTKKKNLAFPTVWVDLENIILREIS